MEKIKAGSWNIILEKATHTQTFNYSESRRTTYFETDPLVVGRFSFKIRFHPRSMFIFIVNSNTDYLDTVLDIHLVHRRRWVDDDEYPSSSKILVTHYTFSSSNDRHGYNAIVPLAPGGHIRPISQFKQSCEVTAGAGGDDDQSATVSVTIGVFHRGFPFGPEFERCVFFQLGTRLFGEPIHYYAEEDVVRTRCPALLDYAVVTDVDFRVFEGVLWFIYKHKLHEYDMDRLPEILAAAYKFGFEDLVTECESVMSFGDSKVFGCSFQVGSILKRFWNKLSRKVKLD